MQIWIRIHNFDCFVIVLQYFDARVTFWLKKSPQNVRNRVFEDLNFKIFWGRMSRTGGPNIEPPSVKSWIFPSLLYFNCFLWLPLTPCKKLMKGGANQSKSSQNSLQPIHLRETFEENITKKFNYTLFYMKYYIFTNKMYTSSVILAYFINKISLK